MTMLLAFEHHGPVKGKGRPRFNRSGGVYTPEATRLAEKSLAEAGIFALAAAQKTAFEGPLVLVLGFYSAPPKSWPAKTRELAILGEVPNIDTPDIDNAAKLVMDAFNGVLWKDDRQIVSLTASKYYANGPCTVVKLYRAGGGL